MPVASESAAATSVIVSASGPVIGYVFPSCPALVSTSAATSAMSPMSIEAIRASAIGNDRVPLLTIEGTWRKYACMNSPARRCVNAIPDASKCCSISPCIRANLNGDLRSGIIPESLTT